MSEYLTSAELADLVGCKPNQRAAMRGWLDKHRWKYIEAKNGLPRVLRKYRDIKLGINDGKETTKLDSSPNLNAFVGIGQRRSASL